MNRALGWRESIARSGDGERRTGVEREERGREKERSGRRDPDPSEAKCIHPNSICLPEEGCHYNYLAPGAPFPVQSYSFL